MSVTSAVIATETAATEAARTVLARTSTAVDACLAAWFASAGNNPALLLASTTALVAGTGSGNHLFDASVLQPGLGAPRPRGFLDQAQVPDVARVGVTPIGALLVALHAHGGNLSLTELASAGVKSARQARASARAELLRRVAQAGPLAFRDSSFVRPYLQRFGRSEGGNVTHEDIEQAQPTVSQPWVTSSFVAIEPATAVTMPSTTRTFVVAACDSKGMWAALHSSYDDDGMEVPELEITAPRFARPVMRGIERMRPGLQVRFGAPIGFLLHRTIPWAALGWQGVQQSIGDRTLTMTAIDWDHLATHVSVDALVTDKLEPLAASVAPTARIVGCAKGPRRTDTAVVIDTRPLA